MELNSDFKVITDLNELESFGKAFYLISYKCTNCGKTVFPKLSVGKNREIVFEFFTGNPRNILADKNEKLCGDCYTKFSNQSDDISNIAIKWYNEASDDEYIWAYMWGQGKEDKNDRIIQIKKKSLFLDSHYTGFLYCFGDFACDSIFYKFEDYGKTWSFTRESLE